MSAVLSAASAASASNGSGLVSKPLAVFASALAKVPLEDIARVLDKDISTASRIRSGERAATASEFARLVPLCGLKLVSLDKVCVDKKAYESMSYIVGKAMSNPQVAQTLTWDEDAE